MCMDNNPKVQICGDESQKLLATASKLRITILINSFRNNDKKKNISGSDEIFIPRKYPFFDLLARRNTSVSIVPIALHIISFSFH